MPEVLDRLALNFAPVIGGLNRKITVHLKALNSINDEVRELRNALNSEG